MPYIHFILELLIVAAGALIIAGAFKLAAWEEWNDYRRLERRAHLNLMRQDGSLR